MRLARRVGAIDQPRERGLSDRETPLLGGIAIFAAAVVAGAIWLPHTQAVDRDPRGRGADHARRRARRPLRLPSVAQADRPDRARRSSRSPSAAWTCSYVTLPFFGHLSFHSAGPTLTVIGLVGMMNVVNFSDGVDGLAAGRLRDRRDRLRGDRVQPRAETEHAGGVLAAITAGAALGFLVHNFPPASSFMGDAGSNLLGLLMGAIAVEGDLKTSAVVTLALPLILLAVPFLDTTFVVLKRLKYRRPVYEADQEHLHHRMARIGFSVRRDGAVLLRLDADARRLRRRAALHPLLRRPRPPARRRHDPRRRARAARRRRRAST